MPAAQDGSPSAAIDRTGLPSYLRSRAGLEAVWETFRSHTPGFLGASDSSQRVTTRKVWKTHEITVHGVHRGSVCKGNRRDLGIRDQITTRRAGGRQPRPLVRHALV